MGDLGVDGAGECGTVGGALDVEPSGSGVALGAGDAVEAAPADEDGVMNIDFVPSTRRPPKGGMPAELGACGAVADDGVDGPAPGDCGGKPEGAIALLGGTGAMCGGRKEAADPGGGPWAAVGAGRAGGGACLTSSSSLGTNAGREGTGAGGIYLPSAALKSGRSASSSRNL